MFSPVTEHWPIHFGHFQTTTHQILPLHPNFIASALVVTEPFSTKLKRKPMKIVGSALLAATVLLGASPAIAQFAKAEDAVKYRQSAFFIMAQNFGRVAAMAQGKAPFDAKVAAESAAIAEAMSKLPWTGFVAGSESAGSSKAKPEIWSNAAKFKEGADKMQVEMAKFSAAAKTGSLDNIKAALPGAGGTCKACHDDFRAK